MESKISEQSVELVIVVAIVVNIDVNERYKNGKQMRRKFD